MFVTKNRVIYLDTQPILSSAMVETLSSITFEQKKGVDFVNTDVNLELQSLQFTAFLFSVCHVIIFVQDWFVDANLVRYAFYELLHKYSGYNSMTLLTLQVFANC